MKKIELNPKIYDPLYHDVKMEELTLDGLDLEKTAERMGIPYKTLIKWMSRYPTLEESYRRGRIPKDLEVEKALLKRALGYEVTEEIKEFTLDKGKKTAGKLRIVTKQIPPDVAAIQMWLTNRKPHVWNNTQKIDITSKGQQLPMVTIGAPPPNED